MRATACPSDRVRSELVAAFELARLPRELQACRIRSTVTSSKPIVLEMASQRRSEPTQKSSLWPALPADAVCGIETCTFVLPL